jgi:hypothetical protein
MHRHAEHFRQFFACISFLASKVGKWEPKKLFLCQCLCVPTSDGSFLIRGLSCNKNTTKNDKNRHNTNKKDKQQRREEIASNNRLTTMAQRGRGGGVRSGYESGGGGRGGGRRVGKRPSTLHLITNMYGVDEGVVEKGIYFLLFLFFFPTS